MLFRLLLLFTLAPLFELMLLIEIGRQIDVGPTIALVIITGVVGAALARHQGLRTFQQINRELAEGRLPGDPLIDALLILVAGVLLVTPGVMTDGVGFLLLLPPVRAVLRRYLKKRFQKQFVITNWSDFGPPRQNDFVDVEAKSVDEEKDNGSNDG